MLMKRLFLCMLCLILTLSGCGYYLKVIKPETPSTKAREAVDNPNPFKEEFVIADASDIRYYKEYWGAAARYLYDTTKLQLYIVELNEFDYNGIETQEAANYRVRDYINENIFSKDPYAVVLGSSDVDKLPNGIAIDFSTNYETWYYGAVASEWFDANARVIWKECYDLRYHVDYDLDSNYVWIKGAISALTGVDDGKVVLNGDFLGAILIGVFVLIVTCLALLFTYLSKKRKEDLAILNTDLKTIDDDSLLDKYESTANKPTDKNN